MKTRHAKGVPCPHNKGFAIDVLDPQAIDCLACKHILRTNPEAKEEFDQLVEDEKKRLKSKVKGPHVPAQKTMLEKEFENIRANRQIDRITTTKIEKVNKKRKPPKCPKCKKRMKLRTNQWDTTQFWGCRQYPKCKGTRNIN